MTTEVSNGEGVTLRYDSQEDFERWIEANVPFWVKSQFVNEDGTDEFEYPIPSYLSDYVDENMAEAKLYIQERLREERKQHAYALMINVAIEDQSTITVWSGDRQMDVSGSENEE